MVAGAAKEWLTLVEAAEILGVSRVTLQRWIKQGRLAAYRLGPRKLRIRRQDLAAVMIPVSSSPNPAMLETVPVASFLDIRPLTEEERHRALKALEESRALGERILARNKGRPLASSVPFIRKAREERARQESLAEHPLALKPLTEKQMEQGRRALELADSVIEMIRARRRGIPLADSADVIRRAREDQARRTLDQ